MRRIATALLGLAALALPACGSSPSGGKTATGPVPGNASAFCDVYRAQHPKVKDLYLDAMKQTDPDKFKADWSGIVAVYQALAAAAPAELHDDEARLVRMWQADGDQIAKAGWTPIAMFTVMTDNLKDDANVKALAHQDTYLQDHCGIDTSGQPLAAG